MYTLVSLLLTFTPINFDDECFIACMLYKHDVYQCMQECGDEDDD